MFRFFQVILVLVAFLVFNSKAEKGGLRRLTNKSKQSGSGKQAAGVGALANFGYDPDDWTVAGNSTVRTECSVSQEFLDDKIENTPDFVVGCRRSSDCGGEPCRYHHSQTLCDQECRCEHQEFMCDN